MKLATPRLLPAALLVFVALLQLPRLSLEVFPGGFDNCQYFLRAQALATGQGFVDLERYDRNELDSFVTAPLLPVLLAVPMRIFGPTMAVAGATFYLLLVASYAGCFLAVRRAFGEGAAWFVVLAQALNPRVIDNSAFCMTDQLFANLVAVVFALSVRLLAPGDRPQRLHGWAFYGVVAGALVWLRYVGFSLAVSAVLIAVCVLVLGRTRRALARASLVTLGAVLPVAALAAWIGLEDPGYLARYSGQALPRRVAALASDGPTAGPAALAGAARSAARQAWTTARWYARALASGALFARLEHLRPASRLDTSLVVPKLFTALWLVLAGIGAWAVRGRLLALVAVHAVPYLALIGVSRFNTVRYLVPLLSLTALLVYFGLGRAQQAVARRFPRLSVAGSTGSLVLLAMAASLGAISLPMSWQCLRFGSDRMMEPWALDYREACEWVAATGYPADTVLLNSKYPTGRVYAGLRGERPFLSRSGDALTQVIAAYDRALILHDGSPQTASSGLPEWLSSHREYVTALHSVGSSTVYEVRTDALRSLLSGPAAPAPREF